jgi:hypothetical protein
MTMVSEKKSLITGGRSNNPHLIFSDVDWNEFLKKHQKELF